MSPWTSASGRSSRPMSCRTTTKPASIAWSKKRCITARSMPAQALSVSAWKRSGIACCWTFRTMVRALMLARPRAWGCSEFRSVLPDSEEHTMFTLSQELGPYYRCHCPLQWNCGARTYVKQIRILLADDHTVMRRGLRLLLESRPEFSVVAEASDGRQAVEQAEETQPDVAVLDIAMPNLSGIEAAQRINTAWPHIAIVILSMHSDEGYVLRALKAGAKGYLLKDSAEGDLVDAIKSVHAGKTFFSPEITRMLMEDYVREIRTRGAEDSFDLLTPREREILQLLAELKSNKEIAQILNLSLYTIETHRRNLQEKLNLHSFAELVLYAVRKGIIS